jgi:AcrR family transcriptional regulator
MRATTAASAGLDGRRARGAATRERLIAAARRLFGEQGYEATSIESVLEAAGVARGALYHHFPAKADLFDAVLAEVLVEIAERSAAAAAGSSDPLAGLRAGSHAWLRMALDPSIQRIALLDPTTAVGWARWREQDEQHSLGGLRASVRRLADEGCVPVAQAELLAHVLLAALNEAALFVANAADQAAAAETARLAVDTLLERLFSAAAG